MSDFNYENSLSLIDTNSKSKFKNIELKKITSTSHSKKKILSKKKMNNLTKQKISTDQKIDSFYLKNLRNYVKEISEENQNLKEKNAELEGLLAAAHDEIEDHEQALIEMTKAYQDLLDKYKKLKITKDVINPNDNSNSIDKISD